MSGSQRERDGPFSSQAMSEASGYSGSIGMDEAADECGDIAASDERYKAKYAKWFTELAGRPEVEHPPNSSETPYHPETPKMLRLRSQWMRDHPEIWSTAETPPGTTGPDLLGLFAKSLTGS
ncbi:hypothetical protein BD310DRAFT_979911 [Dichomitus squalens]|uniref:Uncharacterized protein n=1 Tax=Dichomitus squalens TaxID=114155 RepID=A0A4Q9PLM7_9APHY|nr:hypothetical protein BD310DRAFT_979911 [Dichomitus squalens]